MTKDKPDYQAMMSELQTLLNDMQDDAIDVDQALKKYERGQQLIAALSEYLKTAENTVTKRQLQ